MRFITIKHAIFSSSSLTFSTRITRHHLRHKPLLYHLSVRTSAPFMAGESENFTTDAVAAASAAVIDDDVKYGFNRPEMFQNKLAGTVDPPFDRHVFLCYKSYEAWPSRVEASDDDPLPKLFAAALKARKSEMKIRTRLTICEGPEDIGLSDGDVLVYPEMIKYRGLKESDVDNFVEEVLVSGKPWSSGIQEVLTGSFVFVCAHNKRDRRCGVCGPVLIDKFKEEVQAKDLKDKVFVIACSHIGGHKYAGNLIVFSPDSEGKIAGHWYGYVTPDDVSELVDQHIGKGEIIQRLWRGQMGEHVEETDKSEDRKLTNGTTLNNNEEKTQETATEEKKESVVSCCQGTSGFQCCRDESFEEKPEKKGLINWTGKWEQREVLTAAAILGVAAAVTVAYGFIRKSR